MIIVLSLAIGLAVSQRRDLTIRAAVAENALIIRHHHWLYYTIFLNILLAPEKTAQSGEQQSRLRR